MLNEKKQIVNDTMYAPILTTEEVNGLISEHFIKIFGNVVEHYPAAAIRVLKNRPFKDPMDIYNAVKHCLENLNINDKEKILIDHLDMVAKLADLSRLSLENDYTHRMVGTDQLTIEDKRKLGELNRKYKEKFGFPFICGKENKISTIFTDMKRRIGNTREEEIDNAMEEVMKITKLRIFEIVRR